MEHGHNTTYIAWRLVNENEVDRPISLTVDLLTNQRGHHHESNIWDYNPYIEGDGTQISLRQMGILHYILKPTRANFQQTING